MAQVMKTETQKNDYEHMHALHFNINFCNMQILVD